MIVKSPEFQKGRSIGSSSPTKTNALEAIFGPNYHLMVLSGIQVRLETERENKDAKRYDCQNPLNLTHVPGVNFCEDAESDPKLREMLFVRGDNIRAFRMALNLSEEAVGEFLGLGQKGYQKIESGVTKRTSLARIALLALLLKESPTEIVLNDEDGIRVISMLEKVMVELEILDKIRTKTRNIGNRRKFVRKVRGVETKAI
jgi:transcriptional regulator with XRE-family HTH domain